VNLRVRVELQVLVLVVPGTGADLALQGLLTVLSQAFFSAICPLLQRLAARGEDHDRWAGFMEALWRVDRGATGQALRDR
jgi:hypothetical protein